jgi:hypothetical protein
LPFAGSIIIAAVFRPIDDGATFFGPLFFFVAIASPNLPSLMNSRSISLLDQAPKKRAALITSTSLLLAPSRRISMSRSFQMRTDKPDDCCHEYNLHDKMKAMKDLLDARIGVPLLSKLHARIGQAGIPRD